MMAIGLLDGHLAKKPNSDLLWSNAATVLAVASKFSKRNFITEHELCI